MQEKLENYFDVKMAKLRMKDFFSGGGKKIRPSINQICYKQACFSVPLDHDAVDYMTSSSLQIC